MTDYPSWNHNPPVRSQAVHRPAWRDEPLPATGGTPLLPRGLGRSYGDCCLNDGGILIDTRSLDHFIELDASAGRLRCEAGVSLAAVLEQIVPRGLFLPVSPGTKYVTVGGAIANDIHGKNHHRAGTFGRHVLRFELLRSTGARVVCEPTGDHADLFRATIGGLGLTGLVTWAEFRLERVPGPWIARETIAFDRLDDYFEIAEASDREFPYTVAWIDCMARGRELGRGVLFRGDFARAPGRNDHPLPRGPRIGVPFDAPEALLNRFVISTFNRGYYRLASRRSRRELVPYERFFYPLDGIAHWYRLYGKRGFFQFQCVVPHAGSRDAVRELLRETASASQGSFLAVLKLFGDLESPGILSFPRAGVTLALDLPNRGTRTLALLDRLDAVVRSARGRAYPAKDARMSRETFQAYYPRWRELEALVDPAFSSSFWRRVAGVV
jgi:FAD/FMN-containing dehydrogenase